jgi:hypothetical protein
MSMMGELKYFLGFQAKQLQEGTFISQTKYIQDILTKFGMKDVLGVCFVAEDSKKNTFERSSQKQAPKLLSVKLRHKDKSQDEGSNRLKDELT